LQLLSGGSSPYQHHMGYLFVYGTLQKKFKNPYSLALRSQASFISKGKIQAILYNFKNYPGIILSPTTNAWVQGEIYQLPEEGQLLRMLDEYEGYEEEFPILSEFIRTTTPVLLPDNRWITCWVYVYNGSVEGLDPVTEW